MPSFTTSESALGRVSDETMRRFPALSHLVGSKTASDAGIDPSDPKNVVTALQSNEGLSSFGGAASGEQGALESIFQTSSNLPALGAGSVSQEIQTGFAGRESALQQTISGRSQIGVQQLRALDTLTSLIQQDTRLTQKAKRLETKATQAVDNEILEVRNQALAAKAILRGQLTGVDFNQRQAIISAQTAFFTKRLNELEELREARLSAVDEITSDESASLESKTRTAQARITGLGQVLNTLESQGADQESIAQLRIDRAKEMDRLAKARKDPTNKDIIMGQLTNQFQRTNGRAPTAEERNTLSQQADQVARRFGTKEPPPPGAQRAGISGILETLNIPELQAPGKEALGEVKARADAIKAIEALGAGVKRVPKNLRSVLETLKGG